MYLAPKRKQFNLITNSLLAVFFCIFFAVHVNASEDSQDKLDLTKSEWECLSKKMENILSTELNVVYFDFEESGCSDEEAIDQFKSVEPTKPTQSQQSSEPIKFYVYPKRKINCVKKHFDKIDLTQERFVFIFAKMCDSRDE